jgi:uncharacterized protein (DUF2384 family)
MVGMILAPQPQLEDLSIDPAHVIPTLFRVVDSWALSNAQIARLLGFDSISSVYQWRTRQPRRISGDKLERIAYVLWIYELLHDLFGDGPAADGWPARQNDGILFNGKKPMHVLCSGNFRDIVNVYEWLFGQTQGWH